MNEYIDILKNTKMFFGVKSEEIPLMLNCFNAKICNYQKGEYVLCQGRNVEKISILLEGKLHIQNDDYWGNRSILKSISPGELFGESYVSPESEPLVNDVVAVECSTVIFFDAEKVTSGCESACRFHATVLQNLIYEVSEKNRRLVQKIGHMSKRSTREKLISYLSGEAKRNNSSVFEIPFNRQQLADYLSVDRSAMSNELCKMRNEGMICFNKNRFELK